MINEKGWENMVKVSMEKLGANIRRLREERGWSIEELADKAWATVDYVKKAEAGKRKITVHAVMTFCDAFDVEANELLDGIAVDDCGENPTVR